MTDGPARWGQTRATAQGATVVRKWWKEQRGFVLFLLGLGLFRTAVADWNPVPTGSMRPTILEGDVVLINRLAYQLKVPLTDVVLLRTQDPQRGDVVTFSSPVDGTRLIKRVVGLPGDRVAMHDGHLWLNGQPVALGQDEWVTEPDDQGMPRWRALRQVEQLTPDAPPHRVQRLDGMAAARRDFDPVVVPHDHYLVLGDNRDNSADSRYIGWVPRERLIGRAHRVLVSADLQQYGLPRWSRWGQPL